ncbi:MAG: Xaa-Pro aminopeptidase [Epsilonproteobacteria bacterium]|nr:MAG: Xaa-Pro aminopeptidase [Campylobacterota bacterium]RLA64396.1 MAG: Xaa-Pro aminopeptidase [Campylobacterota bacterium]
MTLNFKNRRQKLFEVIEDGVALIPSGNYVTKSHDTDFPFRQDSNFNYLTGFGEPQALLVIAKNHSEHKTFLFLRPKDQLAELWSGRRLGVEKAQKELGIDKVFSIDELDKELPNILLGHKHIYLDMFHNQGFLQKVLGFCQKIGMGKKNKKHKPEKFINLPPIIGKMRLIKEAGEIKLLKRAATISSHAHKAAMAFASPGKNESEVTALMDYISRKEGGHGNAYESIVAGGDNANILHYVDNNMVLNDKELLLIDAGAEFHLYASDITRTFPINGKYTPEQKDLYQIVLEAQEAAIGQVKVGKTLTENHNIAVKILAQGLKDLGVFNESVEEIIEKNLHRTYYPHGTGHWLGLDVHDNSPYLTDELNDIKFTAGMVFTVEPGLYLPKNDEKVPKNLRGIGIRIEDDILVTDKGFENLSKDIPKSIQEVEDTCATDYTTFLL